MSDEVKATAGEALLALRAENEKMEKEIMALTKGSMGETKAATAMPSSSSIQVLKFGNTQSANEAGVDNGSSWCPPQCSRRTVLGGFFTS